MNNKITAKERKYLAIIKQMSCSVCEAQPPCDAHHVRQRRQYTCIPLCRDCHMGSLNGWHGQKNMWRLKKMDEVDALNKTIGLLFECGLLEVK